MSLPRTTEEENVNGGESSNQQNNPFSYVNFNNNQQGTQQQQQQQQQQQKPTITIRRSSGSQEIVNFKTKTPEQLPRFCQEYGFFIGQEVRVIENWSRGPFTVNDAKLKWMGNINSQLYFGLESDCPQSRTLMYFHAYVQRMGPAIERRFHWLITPSHVRPSHRAFIRNSPLPPREHHRFQTGRMVKVLGRDELAIIKWTGQIDGEWLMGVEVMNGNAVFCPILYKYPELVLLFSCTNNGEMMFVACREVREHQEEINMFPRVVIGEERRSFVSNEVAVGQATELGSTSELGDTSELGSTSELGNTSDIMPSTSSVASSTSQNNPSEHQAGPAFSECIICLSEMSIYAVIPCGHVCLCDECHDRYSRNNNLKRNCPMCRGRVNSFVKVRLV